MFIRAILFLNHGLGEYLGRYEALAKTMSDNGVLVIGHDHGKYCICSHSTK